MDAAVFLRKLADLIDMAQELPETKKEPVEVPTVIVKSELPTKSKIEIGGNEDNFDEHTAIKSDETEVMVPPLQQKIELMKKLSGVESVYDETPCECEGECICGAKNESTDEEELAILKKNAGLAVAVADDFPDE